MNDEEMHPVIQIHLMMEEKAHYKCIMEWESNYYSEYVKNEHALEITKIKKPNCEQHIQIGIEISIIQIQFLRSLFNCK